MAPINGPYVSGTVISSTAINARFADEETETSDSLSRSGKGGMLAVLRGIDGSAAVPSYSFTSDTDTGIYSAGANDIRLAIGGVDFLSNSALTFPAVSSGDAVVSTSVADSRVVMKGNKAAATATSSDVCIGSTATRTAGYIALFDNPVAAASKLRVDYQGLLTLGSQAAPLQPSSMWTAITPNAGWTAANGLAYWKDANGIVRLKGYCTGAAANPAFTLPAGFRPAPGVGNVRVFASSNGAGSNGTVVVGDNGNVSLFGAGGASSSTYLDPVSFLAEQ